MPAGGHVLICAKSVCLKSKTGRRMLIQSNILSNMNEHKLSVNKYRVINIVLFKRSAGMHTTATHNMFI